MKVIIKNLKPIISLIPISLLIVSCDSDAKLAKVREFSENADLVAQTLPVIADDFYHSCMREAQYRPVKPLTTTVSSPNSVDSSTDSRNRQLRSAIAKIDRLSDRTSIRKIEQILEESERQAKVETITRNVAQQNCNREQKVGDTEKKQKVYLGTLMKDGNSIIALYLKKLGTLASKDSTNFDSEFNSLSTNLIDLESKLPDLFGKNPEAASAEQINAGTNLANFIVKQLFNGKRIDTLDEAIAVANEPLKKYIDGLKTIVREVYINQYLKIEESSLDKYYKDHLIEILNDYETNPNNSAESFTTTFISIDRDRWQPEKNKIQERRDLAMSYINLLQTIVDGHEQLAVIYNDGEQPSGQEVKQVINSNNKTVKDFVDRAKTLNKSSQLKID